MGISLRKIDGMFNRWEMRILPPLTSLIQLQSDCILTVISQVKHTPPASGLAWGELLSDSPQVFPFSHHLGICTNMTSSKRHSLTTGPKIAYLMLNPKPHPPISICPALLFFVNFLLPDIICLTSFSYVNRFLIAYQSI